jgi:hypothetical protein
MVIIMITKHYKNHIQAEQLFYLSIWFQRAQPSRSSSTRTRRRHFSSARQLPCVAQPRQSRSGWYKGFLHVAFV